MAKKQTEQEQEKRTSVAKLKVGDYMSETQYYQVVEKSDKQVKVRNERGYEFYVGHSIVEEGMYSAKQFDKKVEVTRTQICEILENAGDSIFTVNFNKQLKEKDVLTEILAAIEEDEGGSGEVSKALKTKINAAIKKGVKGELRTLIGYLIKTEAKMGRSQVIDLEAPANRRYRLVDHRTINWLILKNVKYVAKK
ncbi:MAG: hypothetical protein AAGF11_01120 [Myxococcota bacterium]